MVEACIGCGIETKKGDRRVLEENGEITSVWRFLIEHEFNFNNSVIENVLTRCQYICRKCFNNYTRFIAQYGILKSALVPAVNALHPIAIPRTTAGKKHHTDSMAPVPKKPNTPLVVHDKPSQSRTSTTAVSFAD